MENIYITLLIFIILNLLIILNYKLLFKKINIYDYPIEKRKIHKKPISLTGGLIIYINLIFLYFLFFIFKDNSLINSFYIFSVKNFIIFIFIQSIIFFVGLYDDKYKVNPSTRLIIFTISITLLCMTDKSLVIEKIFLSFSYYELSFYTLSAPFTIFCIIALIVSLNMFDGINLQVSIFYLFFLIFVITKSQNLFFIYLILPLIPVMILNYKNKLFLGDSGSYLISFLIAFFSIKIQIYEERVYSDYIFLILLLPIMDATRVMIERILKGRPIFKGDKIHLQHILIDNYKYTKSIIIIFGLYLIPYIGIFFKINTLIILFSMVTAYAYFIYKR